MGYRNKKQKRFVMMGCRLQSLSLLTSTCNSSVHYKEMGYTEGFGEDGQHGVSCVQGIYRTVILLEHTC